MSQKKDFISGRKAITYLDLFAGAGGFSEGFIQARKINIMTFVLQVTSMRIAN